jgi:hypothetical protein
MRQAHNGGRHLVRQLRDLLRRSIVGGYQFYDGIILALRLNALVNRTARLFPPEVSESRDVADCALLYAYSVAVNSFRNGGR